MDSQSVVSEMSPNGCELYHFHLVEQVDPQAFTEDETRWLWEVIRTQDYAFDDISRNNTAYFCLMLLAPQAAHFFILGEDGKRVGYCLVRDLYERSNPHIHFVIWEKFPVQRAKAAAKEILEWLFKRWKVNRVTAAIPEYNDQAKRLATLLRFQFEGSMREAILFGGRWRHVNFYGLLQDEFNKVVQ